MGWKPEGISRKLTHTTFSPDSKHRNSARGARAARATYADPVSKQNNNKNPIRQQHKADTELSQQVRLCSGSGGILGRTTQVTVPTAG